MIIRRDERVSSGDEWRRRKKEDVKMGSWGLRDLSEGGGVGWLEGA